MFSKVPEIAARFRVSTDSVYLWIKTGVIPESCIDRIGSTIRIRTADFERLLREGKLVRPRKLKDTPRVLADDGHTTKGVRDDAQTHRWTDNEGNVSEHPYSPEFKRPL